jgi:two-component system CheB/CheR fusion protein
MARRGLWMDLRAALRQAIDQRRRIVRPHVEVEADGLRRTVVVSVAPMPPREGSEPLYMVAFSEAPQAPRQDIHGSKPRRPPRNQAVELLEQELREVRERLQSIAENTRPRRRS